MIILATEGTDYRLVTRSTVTRLPVRVLASKSHEWHDIGVVVAGGGIQPGYEALLPFDGKSYPVDPSMPPARRLDGKVQGRIVISATAEGKPVYQ